MTLEQLCHNIKVRMREIDSAITCADDSKSRPPTGDDYNRLWDALWDELRAAGQPFMEEWPPVRPGYPTGVPCWLLIWQQRYHLEVTQRARQEAQQHLRDREIETQIDEAEWIAFATVSDPVVAREIEESTRLAAKQRLHAVAVSLRTRAALIIEADREARLRSDRVDATTAWPDVAKAIEESARLARARGVALGYAIANSVGAEHFGEVADDESRFDDD